MLNVDSSFCLVPDAVPPVSVPFHAVSPWPCLPSPFPFLSWLPTSFVPFYSSCCLYLRSHFRSLLSPFVKSPHVLLNSPPTCLPISFVRRDPSESSIDLLITYHCRRLVWVSPSYNLRYSTNVLHIPLVLSFYISVRPFVCPCVSL